MSSLQLTKVNIDGTEVWVNTHLKDLLDVPLADLVNLKDADPVISDPEQERHRIFCYLLAAIVAYYWNGNKFGRRGTYPLNPLVAPWDIRASELTQKDHPYLASDYCGHNIAALAVDGNGEIIDFDFNHNTLFDSTVEHAEARLVRRVYALSRIYDSWNTDPAGPPSTANKIPGLKDSGGANSFRNLTVYTSLESCAQCTGIMALGNVKQVVYLQRDPTMYMIGNILHRLSQNSGSQAPLPIPASKVGYDGFERMNESFAEHLSSGNQFFKPLDPQARNQSLDSITSFLCSADALAQFNDASQMLNQYSLQYSSYQPNTETRAKTNQECLSDAQQFYRYAVNRGRRGTPHHS